MDCSKRAFIWFGIVNQSSLTEERIPEFLSLSTHHRYAVGHLHQSLNDAREQRPAQEEQI